MTKPDIRHLIADGQLRPAAQAALEYAEKCQLAEPTNALTVLSGDLELTSGPARSDERTYHVSSERIAKELGFSMKKTIRDAVVEIVQAYQNGWWANPDDPLYHNIQQMKAVGSAA